MMTAFTVKVPPGFPTISSVEVQAWLRRLSLSSSPFRIAADPGAGNRVLRLSLPEEQVNALAAKLADPPAVALRRLIATYIHGNPVATYAQVVPGPTRSATPASWFDRHPVLVLVLTLAGIALLLWLLFRKSGGPPSGSGPSAPPLLVSTWSPLQ
jgi:hypothetical protein